MEALLLAGILVFLTFGLMAGLVVAVVAWGKASAKKREEAWQRAALESGLSYTGNEIQGTKYGQRVRVSTVTRGSGNNRQTFTVVSAQLPMPLDAGLNLRRHGILNNMFHASVDFEVGDWAFDRAFIVSADEEHRVRALLGPKLRRLLLEQLGAATFHLGDAGMTVECSGATSDERWLHWAIEITAQAAHELDRARHHTPPASPLLRHRNAWLDYARAAGLTGQDTPLAMWGRLERYDVVAQAVRVDRLHYVLQIHVRLPQPLGIGLLVKEAGMLDAVAMLFGRQGHRLGDPVFDRTFRVETSDPERAGEILDAALRQEILWVRAHLGPPLIDDHGVAVRLSTIPHEPTIVPRVVHQLTGLAERMSARGLAEASGPYR